MIDEKWKEKIENEIKELKDKSFNACMVQKDDKAELKQLIIDAVEKGTDKISKKIEEHEKRISILENAEAAKIKKQYDDTIKTIRTTIITIIVTFFATLCLNNLLSIAIDQHTENKDTDKVEVSNER